MRKLQAEKLYKNLFFFVRYITLRDFDVLENLEKLPKVQALNCFSIN